MVRKTLAPAQVSFGPPSTNQAWPGAGPVQVGCTKDFLLVCLVMPPISVCFMDFSTSPSRCFILFKRHHPVFSLYDSCLFYYSFPLSQLCLVMSAWDLIHFLGEGGLHAWFPLLQGSSYLILGWWLTGDKLSLRSFQVALTFKWWETTQWLVAMWYPRSYHLMVFPLPVGGLGWVEVFWLACRFPSVASCYTKALTDDVTNKIVTIFNPEFFLRRWGWLAVCSPLQNWGHKAEANFFQRSSLSYCTVLWQAEEK